MQTYLWIALGSALGGAGRYWCAEAAARLLGETFPWGTFFVNVAGSLIIGFVATMTGAGGHWLMPVDVRLFLMVGVCGGFTTFSAFSLQTFALIREGAWVAVAGNVLGSLLLCLVGVWLGHVLASAIAAAEAG